MFMPDDFAASSTLTPAPLLKRSTTTKWESVRKNTNNNVWSPVTCCFRLQIPIDGPGCMSKDDNTISQYIIGVQNLCGYNLNPSKNYVKWQWRCKILSSVVIWHRMGAGWRTIKAACGYKF